MTIPYVGRCLGSGEPPRENTEVSEGGRSTGQCTTCSGRFELREGVLEEHETASDAEREQSEPAASR
jgi:hypothetical protein